MSSTQTMTVQQLAKDLNYTDRNVRGLIAKKKLPPERRVGNGAIMFLRADIVLWLELKCPDQSTFERLKASALAG